MLSREKYIESLDQLMTISCILAGFAFSGLIALPGIEVSLFQKIAEKVGGNFNYIFYISFYFLFFSTLCFLGTIMSILVYRVGGYLIPLNKIQRVSLVSHIIFSLAIATLMVSVIAFALPTKIGLFIGLGTGVGVAMSFIWENMVPWQRRLRESQIEEESKRTSSAHKKSKKEEKLDSTSSSNSPSTSIPVEETDH